MNRQYSDNLRDFLYWCYKVIYVVGTRDLQNVTEVLNKIINEPIPDYIKEEADQLLKDIGVLEDKGEVIKELKPYITKLEDKDE